MHAAHGNFYLEWRSAGQVFEHLRDEGNVPPERLLQSIWLHQRLRRDDLKTTEGLRVRVLHPGFLSLEGGPDFRNAVVALGDGALMSGDIELDLRSSGWRAHHHDRNPAFANVMLHVVWECERPGTSLPTLTLQSALDSPLGELSQWLASGAAPEFPEDSRGLCSAALKEWSAERVAELLNLAGMARLKAKASAFQARAKQAGWDQALWEGAFRALGYKQNIWAMHGLGELKPRWQATAGDPFCLEARLLGIAGLLPGELTGGAKAQTSHYVRRLWDQWWREFHEFSDCVLPRHVWRFHGIRPANHPQRRVALAAQWAHGHDLPRILERWCAESLDATVFSQSLQESLTPKPHEFWCRHYTLRSPVLKHPQPLLGGTRITDLAVNAFIPWLWARSAEGGRPGLRAKIEQRFQEWPAGQDNAVLRQARQRILGGCHLRLFRTAVAQQGLLQIAQDFCGRSNAICDGCALPGLIKSAATSQ